MPKNKWKSISKRKRQKIVYNIRFKINENVISSDIPLVVKSVFSRHFDHGVHKRSRNYAVKNAIVNNIAAELAILKQKEHQSGVFKAIVSACSGINITCNNLAKHLKIHRNSDSMDSFFNLKCYLF